ncbi:winged helix-turn-helix transcriptional regulator [Cedecea sp. NFIX57]|uniref:winged helix-turn-helix transcriptional regulator n=1 Tax=Cedecea sp. NFIX57 TaxID=1566286 RepID=UPI000A0B84A5|nr:helix-turn-helix domain-containing protein [Cedecea sp. NFIX57]SMG60886.1 transcriptional regulator, HxlR family [Cedecea sp. NFIX57]
MRSKGFEGMTCSVAGVMGALGDRWGMLIMRDLFLGLSRYDDFRRSSGITNATLSDRLKALEEQDLITRQRYQTRPERYEYLLTEKGRDVGLVLLSMMQVGSQWNLPGLAGPPLIMVDGNSGHKVKVALVDTETGQQVSPQDVRVALGPGADDLTRWRSAGRLINPELSES